ncbi:hypothetical protein FRC17_010606 [Serendipita sp. 399]|nr:hypothetical protein FRC17_010606 [Serendipita sp. 399]
MSNSKPFKKWLDWRPSKKSHPNVIDNVPPPPSQPSEPSNLSVWLLPAQSSPENEKLSSIIKHLAKKYGNYAYHPHVTLAMLPASFPPDIVERVLNEMKPQLFQQQIIFEALHAGQVGIFVYGHREFTSEGAPAGLMALQHAFHYRLNQELQIALERGDEAIMNLGYREVRNIVPMFPHFSIAYTPVGQSEGVTELEQMGLYTRPAETQGEHATTQVPGGGMDDLTASDGMKLGGYRGYQVGALFAAYCGGLRPEKWRIFMRLE